MDSQNFITLLRYEKKRLLSIINSIDILIEYHQSGDAPVRVRTQNKKRFTRSVFFKKVSDYINSCSHPVSFKNICKDMGVESLGEKNAFYHVITSMKAKKLIGCVSYHSGYKSVYYGLMDKIDPSTGDFFDEYKTKNMPLFTEKSKSNL